METNLDTMIYDLAFRVRLYRLSKAAHAKTEELTEREMLLLEILGMKQNLSISDIAALYPTVSASTISMTITKLWKDKKLVKKKILPENQRVTIVSLTPKGKRMVEQIKKADAALYQTIAASLNLPSEYNPFIIQTLENSIRFFDTALGWK